MIRKNQLVAVEFSDHVQDGSRPIRFVVYGRVAHVTSTALVVDSWEYKDTRTKHDRNEQRYTIVRSAIHQVTRLVPVKE